jgi:uncharacterized protein DUF6518
MRKRLSSSIDASSSAPRRPGALVAPVAVAVAIGVGLGTFSVLGEGTTRSLTLLANLASPWGLGAFVVGWRSRSPGRGAALGTLSLVVGMAVFYGISYAAGYVRTPRDVIWTIVAVMVGSVMGACGALLTESSDRRPLITVLAPSGMLLGETVWLVFDRKLWRIDLRLEPYRWADIAVFTGLLVAALLLPIVIPTRAKAWVTYLSIVVSGGAMAIALVLLQRVLLHV